MNDTKPSTEETALEVRPSDLLSVITDLVKNPDVDVTKMERLLAMHERISAQQRKQVFMSALAQLQAKLPQIAKMGQAKNSKFAKLEDIDIVIRPLLAEFGFSFSFDEESHNDKHVTFVATLSHEDGHSEVKKLTVPIDSAASNREGKAIRPAIQDAGSTVSYARRYLIKMHLNLIERDEDTDGENRAPITAEQAKDIEALISEVGADKKRFLLYMEAESVEAILARDFKKACTALESKRKAQP